jgi:hypothetical protein
MTGAGMPKLPGLVRYEEIAAGAIDHALLFTTPTTFKGWVYPARSSAGSSTNPSAPPMGLRVRLKAGFDISSFSPTNQIILKALKKYGMFLDDNGAAWFLEGVPDARFDDGDLHNLLKTHGSDFEVIQMPAVTPQPW